MQKRVSTEMNSVVDEGVRSCASIGKSNIRVYSRFIGCDPSIPATETATVFLR